MASRFAGLTLTSPREEEEERPSRSRFAGLTLAPAPSIPEPPTPALPPSDLRPEQEAFLSGDMTMSPPSMPRVVQAGGGMSVVPTAPAQPGPSYTDQMRTEGRPLTMGGSSYGEKPNALTRGFVSGFAQQNPNALGAVAEAFGHLVQSPTGAVVLGTLAGGSPTGGIGQGIQMSAGVGERLKKASKKLRSYRAGQTYQTTGLSLKDIEDLDTALTYAGETVGQGVASTLAPLAGGAVGALVAGPGGAIAGAAGPSYVLNMGDLYDSLIDEKIPAARAAEIAAYGAIPLAALDAAGSLGILKTITGNVKRTLIKNMAKRIAAKAAKGAASEGGTEATQQIVQEVIRDFASDRDIPLDEQAMNVLDAAIGGVLTGGAMAGAGGVRPDKATDHTRAVEQVNQRLQEKITPTIPFREANEQDGNLGTAPDVLGYEERAFPQEMRERFQQDEAKAREKAQGDTARDALNQAAANIGLTEEQITGLDRASLAEAVHVHEQWQARDISNNEATEQMQALFAAAGVTQEEEAAPIQRVQSVFQEGQFAAPAVQAEPEPAPPAVEETTDEQATEIVPPKERPTLDVRGKRLELRYPKGNEAATQGSIDDVLLANMGFRYDKATKTWFGALDEERQQFAERLAAGEVMEFGGPELLRSMEQKDAARASVRKNFLDSHGQVTFQAPVRRGIGDRKGFAIFSPSTSEPGKWQATLFDEEGPVSHAVEADYDALLKEYQDDYDIDLGGAKVAEAPQQRAEETPAEPDFEGMTSLPEPRTGGPAEKLYQGIEEGTDEEKAGAVRGVHEQVIQDLTMRGRILAHVTARLKDPDLKEKERENLEAEKNTLERDVADEYGEYGNDFGLDAEEKLRAHVDQSVNQAPTKERVVADMSLEEFKATRKPPNFSSGTGEATTYAEKIAKYRAMGDEKVQGAATGNMLADKVEAQAKKLFEVEQNADSAPTVTQDAEPSTPIAAEVAATEVDEAPARQPKALMVRDDGEGGTEVIGELVMPDYAPGVPQDAEPTTEGEEAPTTTATEPWQPTPEATPEPAPAPEPAEATPVATDTGVTLNENTERGTIELSFAGKPSWKVRKRLRESTPKWHWSKTKRLWYNKATDETRALAQEIAGGMAATPETPAAVGETTDRLGDIVRRMSLVTRGENERRPSQGEMRELRDAGLAEETPDHSFFLTDKGQEVLEPFKAARPAETTGEAPTEAPQGPTPEEARATRDTAQRTKAAGQLRKVAESVRTKAEVKMGQDRQTNTARRANMAANAEADAARELQVAETMVNVADAIESGQAPHLAGVRAKTHIQLLDQYLGNAKWDSGQDKGERWEDNKQRPVTEEDLEFVRDPRPRVWSSTLRELADAVKGQRGTKEAARKVRDRAGSQGDREKITLNTDSDRDAVETLLAIARKMKKNGKEPRGMHSIENDIGDEFKNWSRFKSIGINDARDMRDALRELMELRGELKKEDPVKAAERALVGRKIPGYFPTPSDLSDRLVEEAGIQPGDKVLEPSAGKGNIADAIKERHPDADLDAIEPVEDLRKILESKGHRLAGRDFTEHEGDYDKIVMNPPFEDGQDIDHVRRAYDQLKPGGRLVSIMSEGPFFRNDRKATTFRDWLEGVGGFSESLPEGSFKSAERPTGVATRMVVIEKAEETTTEAPQETVAAEPIAAEDGDTNTAENYRTQIDGAETAFAVERIQEEIEEAGKGETARWGDAEMQHLWQVAESKRLDLEQQEARESEDFAQQRLVEREKRYNAILDAFQRGEEVTVATHTRATILSSPDQLRLTKNGEVQMPEGKNWVTLTDEQVENLARQVGYDPDEGAAGTTEPPTPPGPTTPAAALAELATLKSLDDDARAWFEQAIERQPDDYNELLQSARELNETAFAEKGKALFGEDTMDLPGMPQRQMPETPLSTEGGKGLEGTALAGAVEDVKVEEAQKKQGSLFTTTFPDEMTVNQAITYGGGLAASEIDRIKGAVGTPDDKNLRMNWGKLVSGTNTIEVFLEDNWDSPIGTVLRQAGVRDAEDVQGFIDAVADRNSLFGKYPTSLEAEADKAYRERTLSFPSPTQRPGETGDEQALSRLMPMRLEAPTGESATAAARVSATGINPVSIIDQMGKALEVLGAKVPFRVGRIAQKAKGIFKVAPEVIRLRTANDITTASHELGHGVEKAVFSGIGEETWGILPQQHQIELERLGRALYGDKEPVAGYKSEGWATFMQLWLVRDKETQRLAPTLTDFFENAFLPALPEFQREVNKTRELITNWREAGAVGRAKAMVTDPASIKERTRRVAKKAKGAVDEIKMAMVDMGHPLDQLAQAAGEKMGRPLRNSENPYTILTARRMTGARLVRYMVEDGMLDVAGNKVGAPLADIQSLVKGKGDNFTLYLWARRALAMWNDPQGERNPGLDKEDAEQIVRELETPKFQLAAQKVYDWNDGILNYAAQASPSLAEMVEAIRKRDPGAYIPLRREFEQLTSMYDKSRGQGGSPIARLKGSGRRIIDPFPTMISNADRIVSAAHKREVLDAAIRLSQVEGLGHLIEEVPRNQVPAAQVKVGDIVKRLWNEQGLVVGVPETGDEGPAALSEDAADQIPDEILDEAITFFMPASFPKGEDPIIPHRQDGTTKWFQVDRNLWRSLSGVDIYRLPKMADLFLGGPARVFRAGTTGLRASFNLLFNPERDLPTFIANTQSGARMDQVTMAYMSAMRDATMGKVGMENEWFDLFVRQGVEMAQPLGQDTTPTKRAARELFEGKAVRVIDPRNWLDFYRDLISTPESVPRIAEMRLVAKKIGWTPGQPLSLDQALELTVAGKQVTTDFTAAGWLARTINAMTPFHNAAIQGPRVTLRRMKEDPLTVIPRMLGLLTIPTLLAWWDNKDEEWFTQLPWRERLLNWHIPIEMPDGSKEIVRIPRPFEVGQIFAALPEQLCDSWYRQDPKGMEEWFSTVVETTVPPGPWESPVPKLAAEQLANWQFFWERPVVPEGEKDHPPPEQFNEYTSRAAIVLGDMFGQSPRRIDHAIRALMGGVGGDVSRGLFGRGEEGEGNIVQQVEEFLSGEEGEGNIVQQVEEFLSGEEGGTSELSDLPIFGRQFVRGGQSPARSQSTDDLYTAYEKAVQKSQSIRHPETKAERQRRLLLMDATRALGALFAVRRGSDSKEAQRRLNSTIDEIAQAALNESEMDVSEDDREKFAERRKDAELEEAVAQARAGRLDEHDRRRAVARAHAQVQVLDKGDARWKQAHDVVKTLTADYGGFDKYRQVLQKQRTESGKSSALTAFNSSLKTYRKQLRKTSR